MKVTVKRCHTCGALGVGPRAVKLWPFEGRMYCKEDYKDPLTWHESRGNVTSGIQSLQEFYDAAKFIRCYGWEKLAVKRRDWRGFIQETADMAGWALLVGDRRTFVYYAARAVWAWALSQET